MTERAPRLLSLAAGVLPEFTPVQVVHAAADAGFGATGVWFDPATWTAAIGRSVAAAVDTRGLVVLDIEPVFVTPTGDHGLELIDAAVQVGAANVLVVSRGTEAGPFVERFAELCAHAAPAGISVCVEFGLICARKPCTADAMSARVTCR